MRSGDDPEVVNWHVAYLREIAQIIVAVRGIVHHTDIMVRHEQLNDRANWIGAAFGACISRLAKQISDRADALEGD